MPPKAPGLTKLAGKLGATLTSPVLVLGAADASLSASALPQVPALAQVATSGVVNFKGGANLLSKFTVSGPGLAQALASDKVGLVPTGAILTFTLGASMVEQLGSPSPPLASADWSVGAEVRTGEWRPANSPLTAKSVTLRMSRAATGGADGDLTVGGTFSDVGIVWPGYSAAGKTDVAFTFTSQANGDYSLTGDLKGLPLTSRSFNVKSIGFVVNKTGLIQDVGFSVKFSMHLGDADPTFTATASGSALGTFAFHGKLDTNWASPFGLQQARLLKGTGIDFSFAVDGDLGFGLTGNLEANGVSYLATFCVNIQAGVPPVLKAVGVSFETSRLTPAQELQFVAQLATNSSGPKPTSPQLTQFAETLKTVPMPEFNDAKLAFYTPGLSCSQPEFAGKSGTGSTLNGSATFLGAAVGSMKNSFQVGGGAGDGLSINNSLGNFSMAGGALALSGANLALEAPFSLSGAAPQAPSLKVTGKANVVGANVDLTVRLDQARAQFDFDAAFSGVGTLSVRADSVGPSVQQMTDFTLAASMQTNPNLGKTVSDALLPELGNAAKTRKAAKQGAWKKVQDAKSAFKSASDRLKAKLPGNCIEDLWPCISDSVQKLPEYADWLYAGTVLEARKFEFGADAAIFDAWVEIEKAITKAASDQTFRITAVTVSGSVKNRTLSATVECMVLGKKVTSTFTLKAGGGGLGSSAQRSEFLDAAESGGRSSLPAPAVPFLQGPDTATTLTVSDAARNVLSVAVTSKDTARCPDGAAYVPSGTVYLYARNPGELAPDPFTEGPTKPLQLGTAELGKPAGCAEGQAHFNDDTSSECNVGCCNRFYRVSNLEDLRGTKVFVALYQGGPTPCSASTGKTTDIARGFRASLSNEVTLTLPGRADDVGFINVGEHRFGTWRKNVDCPAGTWATAVSQRVESKQGGKKDDTALNSVRLVCTDKNGGNKQEITSHAGFWGDWATSPSCPPGSLITTARIRLETGDPKDETGANDTSFKCSDGAATELSAGNGATWGKWLDYQSCPVGSAVCGVSVKVEDKANKAIGFMGMKVKIAGDDTGMDGLELRCCATP